MIEDWNCGSDDNLTLQLALFAEPRDVLVKEPIMPQEFGHVWKVISTFGAYEGPRHRWDGRQLGHELRHVVFQHVVLQILLVC